MAQKSIDMNLVKQVQQLRNEGIPIKEIVRRTGISRKTVKKYLRLMEQLPKESDSDQIEGKKSIIMPDRELAAIIYNNDVAPIGPKRFEDLVNHFEYAKKELHKTGVNKQILCLEYLDHYPDGYKYSQYCNLFMRYLKNTDPAFHWEYEPGEFNQIDFAGKKLSYVNRDTREVIYCQVFVAILPYSGLIFCKAVHSQKTADFVCCINEMVKYIGCLLYTSPSPRDGLLS